jgi:hypothetical protein
LKQGEAIIYRMVTNTDAIKIQIRDAFGLAKPQNHKNNYHAETHYKAN